MCICLLDKDAFTTLTRPSRPEGMTADDRSSVCAAPISAKSDWFPFPSRLTVTPAVTFVSAVIFSADASLGTSPRSMVVTRSPEY